jgi:signal transduction histidine kinase
MLSLWLWARLCAVLIPRNRRAAPGFLAPRGGRDGHSPALEALWCIALVGCSLGVAAEPERRNLSRDWQVLLDPSGALTFDDARAASYTSLTGAPALGYRKGAIWLRNTLDLSGLRPGEHLLELQLPAIDSASLYWPTPSGAYQVQTSGDRHPIASRDVPHRNVVFRVDLPDAAQTTFYLRVAGTNNQTFSVVLWTPDAFFRAALDDQLLWGALFALHAVLLLSNLWLFQATRDAPTGLFVAFICVSFGAIVFTEGFGYVYLLGNQPGLNHLLLTTFWMLSVPTSYAFLFSYAGLFRSSLRWPTVTVACVAALAAMAILIDLTLAPSWVRPLFSKLQLFSTVALCLLLAWLVRRGSRPARLLLIAMLPTLISIGLKMARNLGWLQPSPWIDNAYLFGLAAYLLMLNYGITRRYQALRLEKESVQRKALELAQHNERELEWRVNQRTEEIATAMRRVQHALDLERRLISAQRDLYATISHELRTPVTVIDLSMQNLMRQQPDPAPAVLARYRKIVEATGRLSHLLGQYLKQDRLSTLQPGPTLKWTLAADLLQDASAAARLYSSSHPLRIQQVADADRIWCDPMLTRLALNNLAENAVKYTPPGTTVRLSVRRAAEGARHTAVLEVQDSGPGMTEDELGHAFEPGFRGARSASCAGSGMGLTMARHVIEQQGGSLTLESRPGEGMTGTIRLPHPPSSPSVQHPLDAGQPEAADLRHEGIDRA